MDIIKWVDGIFICSDSDYIVYRETKRGIDFVWIIGILLIKVMPNMKYVKAHFNVLCNWFMWISLLINLSQFCWEWRTNQFCIVWRKWVGQHLPIISYWPSSRGILNLSFFRVIFVFPTTIFWSNWSIYYYVHTNRNKEKVNLHTTIINVFFYFSYQISIDTWNDILVQWCWEN